MSVCCRWSIGMAFVVLLVAGCGPSNPGGGGGPGDEEGDTYEVERIIYKPPPPADDGLADDSLDDKKPAFVERLVDRRPLDGWLVNQSAAVIRLDTPLIKNDHELLVLHSSYEKAHWHAKQSLGYHDVLPSVNLLDGKAKQFDDGLYAAIDLAWFKGEKDQIKSHIKLVERILAKVDPAGPAAAYLAAGLTVGGHTTSIAADAARDKWVKEFNNNPALSKPIGFYSWSDDLKQCWRFMRFFQQTLKEDSPEVTEIVAVLAADPALKADYDKHEQFFGRLTSPLSGLGLSDLVGVDVTSAAAIAERRKSKGIRQPGVAFFPPSTSRETELFNKLFPLGVPEGANLMKDLVTAIRSGKVDLAPKANSGWYDHQVYALETLLLPSKGEETQKLLLTKAYKKRMLEAFQALITKRRETHVRQLDIAKAKSEKEEPPPRPKSFAPRLRVEPCPTFYVRTARSYAFLENFLTASLGAETLKALHGRKADGVRPLDLAAELAAQKELFYGLYLISCDDIGLTPQFHEMEGVDIEACFARATAWLEKAAEEADLAADTRVAVPMYVDPQQGTTRLWVTLGVRLTKLDVHYARPPSIKPATGDGNWEEVKGSELAGKEFLIAVDEFAEVEVPTLSPPSREELRKICDAEKTKEKILAALKEGKW